MAKSIYIYLLSFYSTASIFLTNNARPTTEGDFYVDGSVTNSGAALIDSHLSIAKLKTIHKKENLGNKNIIFQNTSHLMN